MSRPLYITRWNHDDVEITTGIKKVTPEFFHSGNGYQQQDAEKILKLKPGELAQFDNHHPVRRVQ